MAALHVADKLISGEIGLCFLHGFAWAPGPQGRNQSCVLRSSSLLPSDIDPSGALLC